MASKISEVLGTFKQFDINGDGTISREELTTVCSKLDPTFTEASMKSIFEAADLNKDERISIEEFVTYIFRVSGRLGLDISAEVLAEEDLVGKTKEEYAEAFVPKESASPADWVGTWIDMFSPDDTNPASRRFVDFDAESGTFQVSADTGGEKWGRRFDTSTPVNPTLAATDVPHVRKTSFLSKIPEDAPIYADAKNGALEFTLVMGTAFGHKVLKWNGLYDGKGGKFGDNEVPPSDCDNFWRCVLTKEDYGAAFVPKETCSEADWLGTLVDMFSPDDTNPSSRRFIDLDKETGELQVSADTGGEKWGRRFDKTTSVNPVMASTEVPHIRKTSFLSKVPEDAPIYADAKAGALNFTLILGTAFGQKVIKWNGLYDGKGGEFGGNTVPPCDCDNFWRFTKTKEDYAAAFVPMESCTDEDWLGTLLDLFSPDDTNPLSRRFIDYNSEAGEFQVSADTGGEKWGRRFDTSTPVNPTLTATDAPNTKKTSFFSKVPEDAPIYADAKAGALDFTLTLGLAFGQKVLKWNGLYDGKGGSFGGDMVPPSDCDNFWRFIKA
mmetsp:Transcript_28216/g.51955  ORF Transcript_28216/g.51955 Transcript_28216/m.51955 type:complete len:553 (-) Transcript_28216:64-1722(-)